MASLIQGFDYDIFISYRQKDNKGDKWVSEFVEALRDELESTFKEEISVYFDENPHDGLLETHDVDASIKDKLKCLIFIPVLSRTYCDPNAFGWEHEFKEFVKNASQDQFGLKIKLPSGNVANRVLPIRIHDLDKTDIALCESVTGGVLRGVEFIYKSPGVNRPLRPKEDKSQENLSNTIYRDQINKVALAIKEIIQGLKTGPGIPVKRKDKENEPIREIINKEKKISVEKTAKPINRKLFSGIIVLAILIVAALIAYQKFFKREMAGDLRSSDGRISVAVMPFQNMTNDIKLNNWQNGIQNELINNFTNSEALKVESAERINESLQNQRSSEYTSVAGKIAEKLGAAVFISGSINQSGSMIRINAQITNSRSGNIIQSFKGEGLFENGKMFPILDPLAAEIKNFLIIAGLKEEVYLDPERLGSSNNPNAYANFTYGMKAFNNRDYPEAIKMLSEAVSLDSTLYILKLYIGFGYYNQGMYDEAKKWCLKAYQKKDLMNIQQQTYTNFVHSVFFETPLEGIKYLKQLQGMDDQWPNLNFEIGCSYAELFQYDKAIPEFEKALGIFKKKGLKPFWPPYYTWLGKAYYETGQYKKGKKLYKNAEQDCPDDPGIIQGEIILALSGKNLIQADQFAEKYRSLSKENGTTEADILTNLGLVYSQTPILDIALEYYRQALRLEPGNPSRMNSLAYFLIEKNWDINEGMDLIEKALALHPDDYNYLHTKGWGLYKQGAYKEALEILQKSWDLRRQNAIYNHEAFLHLESAKKAVTGQK
jgi:tetratricopeptide (TPR) repeat protein